MIAGQITTLTSVVSHLFCDTVLMCAWKVVSLSVILLPLLYWLTWALWCVYCSACGHATFVLEIQTLKGSIP